MELFEEFAKYKIPEVHISAEEWEKEYSMIYSVLGLDGPEGQKKWAVEDCIRTYLLLQAKKEQAAI